MKLLKVGRFCHKKNKILTLDTQYHIASLISGIHFFIVSVINTTLHAGIGIVASIPIIHTAATCEILTVPGLHSNSLFVVEVSCHHHHHHHHHHHQFIAQK